MRNILKGYHERTAIGVTLSAGTDGTATYVPETGQPTLSSLPVGAQIVKINDDYLIKYNNTTIGEVEATAYSDYNFDSMAVSRGGTQTTISSTPITLQNGDEIDVMFVMKDYLCFTANTAGSTVQLTKEGSPTEVVLETKTNGGPWTTYTVGNTITLTNVGDKVYWRNTSETDTRFSKSEMSYYQFVMTGSINGSGDINFLLNKKSTTTLSYGCYLSLFNGCTGLITAPTLPATTLATMCYYSMFYGCSGLTAAPTLPATSLKSSCYEFMFSNCSGLTSAPTLSATTLADNCYRYMFYGCSGLTTATTLPATTLASNCYEAMFLRCVSLTTPPALNATKMYYSCYQDMFGSCSGLTSAPALPATTLASNCYYGMFKGCSGLTILPELPATTLTNRCYSDMFKNCSKIKISDTQTGEYTNSFRVPSSGTGTDATNSMANMFTSTGGTFTGTPTIDTTYYTSNTVVSAS